MQEKTQRYHNVAATGTERNYHVTTDEKKTSNLPGHWPENRRAQFPR